MTDTNARAALAARQECISTRNLIMGLAQRRANKRVGMAAALQWRESRRCQLCGALAFEPCAHRPEGAHVGLTHLPEPPEPTDNRWGGPAGNEHIPFPGHRTVAEVREHEGRKSITRRLGK